MSSTQNKVSVRSRPGVSRGQSAAGRGAAKRPQGRGQAAFSQISATRPKRGGASKPRSFGRKPKQSGLEQLMGKVAGAAGGAKSSKRTQAIMALVGAGGAGLAAFGKKRKAQGQADEPPAGPQVHVGAAENAEPVVVDPDGAGGR